MEEVSSVSGWSEVKLYPFLLIHQSLLDRTFCFNFERNKEKLVKDGLFLRAIIKGPHLNATLNRLNDDAPFIKEKENLQSSANSCGVRGIKHLVMFGYRKLINYG